jgi:hypothetical protein
MSESRSNSAWFDRGFRSTAEEFFEDRLNWLAEPDSVRVVQSEDGGYDIMLRIDGTYFGTRETAQSIAQALQAMICGHVERIRAARTSGGSRP